MKKQFDYTEQIAKMKFSHSSLNSFRTCKLGFKMAYLDKEQQSGNAFGDFGSYLHSILEKYFKGELEVWDLAEYYQENYDRNMHHSFPDFPKGMDKTYFLQGLNFFDNFEFDKSRYEIIAIEEKLTGQVRDINFTFIPDLVLKEKASEKLVLFDYKTSNLFKKDKLDKKKLNEYKIQMGIYVYMLYQLKGIEIKEVNIWAIRNQKMITYDYDPLQAVDTLSWITDTVDEIRNETEWEANTKESYYCLNICSLKLCCPEMVGYS